MEQNDILMIYGTNYKEMTKQLLTEAKLWERIPDKQSRIGIKPTWYPPRRRPGGPPPIRRWWKGLSNT